jgi:hypothetical protein
VKRIREPAQREKNHQNHGTAGFALFFDRSTATRGAQTMSDLDQHADELDHFETMMGTHRGKLAVALDMVTNALVLVGQHGVYCHTNRDADVPVMDIRVITAELTKAKQLIQTVMEGIRAEREDATGKASS